ncbi:hypothetical protein [Streptomyces sp. SDr-06]|uniref:hypothetical protein n=1 Tax=Streptomyces sp. SDr-06 TaxID=2267702 RepID=UPI00167220D6|nr:hypothetical protein [Streptomyces sp. SDr-06]
MIELHTADLAPALADQHAALDEARARSLLPGAPTGHDALHDFVVRVRIER